MLRQAVQARLEAETEVESFKNYNWAARPNVGMPGTKQEVKKERGLVSSYAHKILHGSFDIC